jgi:hypothetical protein
VLYDNYGSPLKYKLIFILNRSGKRFRKLNDLPRVTWLASGKGEIKTKYNYT